ncbi:MAG: hypothetical protein Tsb0013_10880 [Phycisphaerales bacterium]
MRFTSLFVICLASLLALTGARALGGPEVPQATGPKPPLVLDPPVFDAGYIDPEDLIYASFQIKNPTDQLMVIDGFTTSCKCTAPVINQREIRPGGEVTVSATVDLRGSTGPIRKSFMLKFRGYDRQLECEIRAFMTPKVAAEPVRLRDFEGVVRLTATDGRPFAPLEIHNEGVEYSFVAVSPPGAAKAMVWDVRYQLPRSSQDTSLLIETDHRKCPLVTPRMFTAAASRPEVEYIKQRDQVYSVRTHANVGLLDQGDSVEIGCQIRRPLGDHDEPMALYTETPGLEAELVAVEEIPGENGANGFLTKMYTVRLTNTGAPLGGFMTPLYFEAPVFNEETGKNYRTRIWVMGVVRESDESAEPIERPAPAGPDAQGEE